MRSEFEGQLKLLLIEGGIDDTAFVFEEVLDEGDFGTDENSMVGAHVGSDGRSSWYGKIEIDWRTHPFR